MHGLSLFSAQQLSYRGMRQSEWSLCKDLQMEDALWEG